MRPLLFVRLLSFCLVVVVICTTAAPSVSFNAARAKRFVTLDVTSTAQAWPLPGSAHRSASTSSAGNLPLDNSPGSGNLLGAANRDIAAASVGSIVATELTPAALS